MKPFETQTGPKQACRQKLLDACRTEPTTPDALRIFTLPSREHRCYSMFKDAFPTASVVCIERDAEIYRSLNNAGITTERVTTTDYLEAFQPWQTRFDCMFLDYYSFYGKAVEKDLRLIADKNVLNTGWSVLGLTLAKSIRVGKDDVEALLDASIRTRQNESLESNIDNLYAHIASEVFKDADVRLHYKTEYTAGEGSMPMLFMILLVKTSV